VKDALASRIRSPNLRWPRSKPTGAWRFAFRLPIYLYRLNLGWLLGHRFLLLVHRGRRSSLRRETVLEVILHDSTNRECVVLSAWGKKADWYRNLQKTPAVEVQTGSERYRPVQRFLSPEEAYAALTHYESHHPWAAWIFAKLFGYPLVGSEAARRAFAESMSLVAFRPV
jgi:deazaflavin-dependent oxidoreductase (nitroreductase family)